MIVIICALIYYNQQFVKTQVNKARGMYYVAQGDKAYKKREMQDAIKFYNNGLKLYPAHYDAWCNLGNIYVAYEDYYSALHAYSQAFKYNPNMMMARMNYGLIASQKLGNFDKALEQYNKVIQTQRKTIVIPYIYNNKVSTVLNKAIAYYNIGVTYRLKSLYNTDDNWELKRRYLSKAIEAYKKSLEIAPKRYDTLYNLGIAYHLAGRYSEAGEYYCKAIKQNPMDFEAHYNLAILHRRMKHYRASYEEIEKASTLVSASGDNSGEQQYVSVMMNDILHTLREDEDYKKELRKTLSAQRSVSNSKDKKKKLKPNKKKNKDEISDEDISLINGKISASEELDKAVLGSFSTCSGMEYFEIDE